MRKWFLLVATAVLLLLGLLTYYVGLRGWQWLVAVWPGGEPSPWAYWVPFSIVGLSFPLSRFVRGLFPRPVRKVLLMMGAYWLVVLLYMAPLLADIDLGRALVARLGLLSGLDPAQATGLVAAGGGIILVPLAAMLVYGTWRARNPVVVRHDIAVAKSGGKHRDLHVVLASDTHFGATNGHARLDHLVEMVNSLDPDLVLLAGDITDDDLEEFVVTGMPAGLAQLKSRLGVYAVLGNHDPHGRHISKYRNVLEQAGIRLLVDESVKVDDSLHIIGRDDISNRSRSGRSRASLEQLLEGVDRSLPLILMDHQPYRLQEAEGAGIDLQVSGHTHRGQMFPNNLLTRRLFELDWGYLRKGATHVIVSLGFGTWGPPIRVGNTPEVVSIRMRFMEGDHPE